MPSRKTSRTSSSTATTTTTTTATTKSDDVSVVPFWAGFFAYVCYLVWIVLGKLHQYIFSHFENIRKTETPKGYAPLCEDFSAFFTRYIYGRISDCLNRPICSAPGAWIDVVERSGCDMLDNIEFTGTTRRCLNLGSYNYLGFAENSSGCIEDVIESTKKWKTSCCSSRSALGTTEIHKELEQLVARFVGKEDAIVFGMGYATNSTSLPGIIGEGALIVSDSLNHASLVFGTRSSKARVEIFKHNDFEDLERVLKEAIVRGQPGTHLPYTKILIVVEGIYSMEGEILRLPEIIAIKKKYKAYLYVDEAHSIGALGPRGRGVCDYWGIDTNEVDILMGTFTKSFGSTGGYIASSKDVIENLRVSSFAALYDTAMSIPAAQQILSSMKIIMGEDGTNEGAIRLSAVRENSNYFRRRLMELGFLVFGDEDSPIIPMMIYSMCKVAAFSRECLANNIAVVIVGYPATPVLLCRARFCISAAHTIEDLERAIQTIDRIGEYCFLRYNKKQRLLKASPPPSSSSSSSSSARKEMIKSH